MEKIPKFIEENEDLFAELKLCIGMGNTEKSRNQLKRLINVAQNNIDLYDIFFICEFELKKEKFDSFHEVLVTELEESQYGFSLPFDNNLLEPEHIEYLEYVTEGLQQKWKAKQKIFLITCALIIIFLLLAKLFGVL